MASPDYLAIRNAILDNDIVQVYQGLVDSPRGSLVECWNSVVALLTYSGMPDDSRLEAVLDAFVSLGMGLNDVDTCGYTPLTHAALNKLSALCALLITAGADVKTTPRDAPYSPLSEAFRQEDWVTVRLLYDHGAWLGGTRQPWDGSFFRTVIGYQGTSLFRYLLAEFRRNKKSIPWKDIMTVCAERKCEDYAMVIVTTYRVCIQEDINNGPSCPYLWCLTLAELVGFKTIPSRLIHEHPRLLLSGLSEGSVAVQRSHDWANSQEHTKRRLTDVLNQYRKLDLCGPEWEVKVYNKVHKHPAPLQMYCRTAVLKRLRPNDRAKIQYLPLAPPIRSYLCASTNQTALNLDPETRDKARRLRRLPKYVKKLLVQEQIWW